MDAIYWFALGLSWFGAAGAVCGAVLRCRHADAGWRDAYEARYGEHLARHEAQLFREIADAAIAREKSAAREKESP